MARPGRALEAGSALLSSLASGVARILGLAGALAIVGLAAAALVAGPAFEATFKSYMWYDVSPLNPGAGGSSSFYLYARKAYGAVLGGPGEASEAALRGARVLYVVLGPDKPFGEGEVEELVKAYETGRLRILVADDIGVTRSLLRALGAPGLGGLEVNPRGAGYWRYVLSIDCPSASGPSTKALSVEAPPGARVLCRYRETGDAAVVWRGGPGWSGVLVVGDASIYSNFLYRGELGWLGSSRSIAVYTLEASGAREADLIVFDDEHYNYTEFHYRGQYGVGLIAESFHSLRRGLTGFTAAHPLVGAATLTGLTLALAAILVGPSRGLLRVERGRLTRADAAAVSRALDMLGYTADERLVSSMTPEEAALLLRRVVERG